MARRREKEKVTDPFERARLKKLRAQQRREDRKRRRQESGETTTRSRREAPPDYSKPMVKDDYLWIRRGLSKEYGMKLLNEHKERPYWLSIAHELHDPIPVPYMFPSGHFRTEERIYFGFLFREHRDLFFDQLEDARKEFTEVVRKINPKLF